LISSTSATISANPGWVRARDRCAGHLRGEALAGEALEHRVHEAWLGVAGCVLEPAEADQLVRVCSKASQVPTPRRSNNAWLSRMRWALHSRGNTLPSIM
jgi:hypothetical protein